MPVDPDTNEVTAHVVTNNTAELGAIIGACRWVLAVEPRPPAVAFLYDSTWAANCARGLWKPRSNSYEVDAARRAIEKVTDLGIVIEWHHVRSHRGHFLNELADLAAKMGCNSTKLAAGNLQFIRQYAEASLETAIDLHLGLHPIPP